MLQALAADIGALVKGGRARLLAVSGATRDPAFPDVSTFKEQGYDMEGGSTNDQDNFQCVVNGQVPPDLEAYMQSAPRFNQAP